MSLRNKLKIVYICALYVFLFFGVCYQPPFSIHTKLPYKNLLFVLNSALKQVQHNFCFKIICTNYADAFDDTFTIISNKNNLITLNLAMRGANQLNTQN